MSHHVTPTQGEMARLLAGRMAEVLSELSGTAIAVGDANDRIVPGWVCEGTDDGTPANRVKLGFADDDAQALASRVGRESNADVDVAEVLSNAWAMCLDRFGDGTRTWSGTVLRAAAPVAAWSAAYRLEGSEGLGVTAMVAVEPAVVGDTRRAHPAEPERSARPTNLEVILDIDLPLSVRFGGTDMTIEALTRMGPGALIDLGRSPDEPVDVMVNGRTVARGEVVVVGGNYGVRVTEVVSAADRLRSMGM